MMLQLMENDLVVDDCLWLKYKIWCLPLAIRRLLAPLIRYSTELQLQLIQILHVHICTYTLQNFVTQRCGHVDIAHRRYKARVNLEADG